MIYIVEKMYYMYYLYYVYYIYYISINPDIKKNAGIYMYISKRASGPRLKNSRKVTGGQFTICFRVEQLEIY